MTPLSLNPISDQPTEQLDTEGLSVDVGGSLKNKNVVIPRQFQDKYFRFVLLKKNSKIPFEDDWQNTANYSYDNPKLLDWIAAGGNVGLISGYGIVRCIDDDTGKLAADLKEVFADTYQEKTWSGKTHFFILTDYNENHVFPNKLGEFRAKNFQAVISPSVIDNKPYMPLNDKPLKWFKPADIKAILQPYLKQESNERLNDDSQTDNSNSGLEFRECIRYCKYGLKKGLSNVEIKEYVFKQMGIMLKWSKAHPDYRELTFKKALEAALKDIEQKKETENKPIEVLNLQEALDKGVPEIEYVINPILRKGGLTIVGGEPGAKKTIFAIACSLAIAKGKPILEKFETTQAKVLYLDYENGLIVILNRFQDMNAGIYSYAKDGLNNVSLSVFNDLRLDNPKHAEQLHKIIQDTGSEVVIVDSLVRCMEGDEDRATEVRIVFDNLKDMMAEGISFILIHHTKKGIEKKTMGSLRGSSDLGGMAEVILMLSENGDFTNVTLEKHRHLGKEGMPPFAFLLEKSSGDIIKLKYFECTPEQAEAKQLAYDDLLEWINDNDFKQFRTKAAEIEMKKVGGHSKNAVSEALTMLKKNRIIAKKTNQSPWEVL